MIGDTIVEALPMKIDVVETETQLHRLLPLMRAYCTFYAVAPSDASLLLMSRALMADPLREGKQFLATDGGEAVGFATLFWSWASTIAGRVGVMNDLFVLDTARGRGVGTALIDASAQACRERGALRMVWQTALDNRSAQSLYDRVGAVRETWVDYWLDTG
jgi:GNAT superfamily N-acetyltransferase